MTVFLYIAAVLLAAACGYLIGSINGAIITVRLFKGKDIRDYGSKNAGLTNTIRCFGKGCGIMTLVIDIGKGAAAIALTLLLSKQLGWAPLADGTGNDYRWLGFIAAAFAILGHMKPIYYHFSGGKGVLVGVSVFLVLNPLTFVVLMAIFGLLLWRSKYVSLSSMIATVCVIPTTFLFEVFLRGTTMGMACLYTAMVTVMAIMIIGSHHENIQRLRAGTERRIGGPKPKENENIRV
ncbi:MAG: glycerol-3-phosphate 1-O-acyltransferase PlsY [Oscillospiraceae bacterium]|nr:glycerol-3-phosphate 1-O-acyltransferase PlsY [Oscillospiraceae bacterium]